MKAAVLCISLAYVHSLIQDNSKPIDGLYPIDVNAIPNNVWAFLNRDVVDTKQADLNMVIGMNFPQVIPYTIVRHVSATTGETTYLTYSRDGTEDKLSGKLSIGLGGHVDLDTATITKNGFDPQKTILENEARELKEEVNLEPMHYGLPLFMNMMIINQRTLVDSVHIGLPSMITVFDQSDAQVSNEVKRIEWLTKKELIARKDNMEEWSKIMLGVL